MNPNERSRVTRKILKRYELYKIQSSRIKRILKSPFRTIPWFFMNALAYVRPYRVNYRTLWGDRMSFYLPEGNPIYYYGFFEANLTNFFLKFLQEGDIFFDVGSHVGFYSVLASRLVGTTGQVHSFEPTPRTFETMRKNMLGKSNSKVNNCAVMDKETEIEFVDYGPKHSAFNSFKNRTDTEMKFLSPPQRIKVKTISLDKYCADKHIVPTFIKIDAEGAEHIILKAMENILSEKKTFVSIEVAAGAEWQENCRKSIDFLIERGYRGFEISVEGYLSPYSPKNSYVYDNLIFAHESNLSRLEPLLKPMP